jgi:hypothetical protein
MYLHVYAIHMQWSVQMICIHWFGVSSNGAFFGLVLIPRTYGVI